MLYWIYDYPSLNIGALFGVLFVTATWLSILFIRLSFHSWIHGEKRANDMVGFALSSFSVLYGLLVGLLAVAAYQNFFQRERPRDEGILEPWGTVSRSARLSAAGQGTVAR